MFKADLHTHTIYSDGTKDPQFLVSKLVEMGFSGLSITDHDTFDAYFTDIEIPKNFFLLPGAEFSARLNKENIHILAYGFNPHQETPLKELCALHQKRRLERNLEILEKLKIHCYINVPEEIVYQENQTVGRPHIAQYLIEIGKVKTITEAFHRFLGENKIAYAPGEPISVPDTLDAIHASNALAVLAHPHLLFSKKTLYSVLEFPFDGIECYYARMPHNKNLIYEKICSEKNLIPTGGSDYHGIEESSRAPLGSSWAPQESFETLYNHYLSNT